MSFDEPADRSGQDPYAYAAETDEHNLEREKFFLGLLRKKLDENAPDQFINHLTERLGFYQNRLLVCAEARINAGDDLDGEYERLEAMRMRVEASADPASVAQRLGALTEKVKSLINDSCPSP